MIGRWQVSDNKLCIIYEKWCENGTENGMARVKNMKEPLVNKHIFYFSLIASVRQKVLEDTYWIHAHQMQS